MGRVIVSTAPELCQNFDFFLKKRKEFFAYVMEFMLSLAKMQKDSTLMCKKFEI